MNFLIFFLESINPNKKFFVEKMKKVIREVSDKEKVVSGKTEGEDDENSKNQPETKDDSPEKESRSPKRKEPKKERKLGVEKEGTSEK